VELIADQFDELFLQDCDQEAKAGAHRRVARQSALAFSQPLRGAAWRSIPSTYVVCAEDQPPAQVRVRPPQRSLTRAVGPVQAQLTRALARRMPL